MRYAATDQVLQMAIICLTRLDRRRELLGLRRPRVAFQYLGASSRFAASHTRTVLSALAVTTRVPSRLNAALQDPPRRCRPSGSAPVLQMDQSRGAAKAHRAVSWEPVPNSSRETVTLVCPATGRSFQAPVWIIVDSVERPDLLELIRQRKLQQVTSPFTDEPLDAN